MKNKGRKFFKGMYKAFQLALVTVTVLFISLIFNKQYACAKKLPSGIDSGDIGKQIEDFVDDHESTTVGMAMAVFDSDDVIYNNYFGFIDKENKISTDEDSVFEWGSATKLLVWISVMQLYEQGRIDLEADINTYLPENFLQNINYDTPITMINLMNHNAGFQEMVYDIYTRKEEDIEDIEVILKKYQPEQIFEPGTVTAYSNWSTALAGYIVEQITGQEFYEYVNENIFQVLGMEHTSVKPDYSDNTFVRRGWDRLKRYNNDGELRPFANYYIALYPTGACASDLEDYIIFAKALLSKNCPLFQYPETYELFFSPTEYYYGTDIPRNCHGIWMEAYAHPVYGHGGNSAGCSAYILLQPESNIGAVVMTNQYEEEVYNGEMMELIFGEYKWENYFPNEPELPASSVYKPARTFFKGGLKLKSLGFYNINSDNFFVWNKESDIINLHGEDYISYPVWHKILENSLLILWIISIPLCIVMLLTKLILGIRIKEKRPMSVWAVCAMIWQLLVVGLFSYIAYNAWISSMAESYLWAFKVIFLLWVIMIIWMVRGFIKLVKSDISKGTKMFCSITLCTLVISIINVLYWNMFMFWIV